MADFKFVGFPHRGKFVQLVPADKPNLAVAKQYFEDLLVGKDQKFVYDLCAAEQKAENEGRHDAQSIHCGENPAEEGRFEITYRFAVKDERGDIIPAALIWSIYLDFRDKVVASADPKVELLTP